MIAGILTYLGFFSPGAPLWLAGVPLLAAILTGRRAHRAIAVAAFLLWPAMLCAGGLVGIGYHPAVVWPVAAVAVIMLCAIGAFTGVVLLALILSAFTVFPASPFLVLADVLPGTGPFAPFIVLIGLVAIEIVPKADKKDIPRRAGLLATLAAAVLVWSVAVPSYSGASQGADAGPENAWRSMDEPRALSERGRWIALRDALPQGSQVILGENVFRAGDQAAIAFWCDAARQRELTLWIGVRGGEASRRGQVWRFDPDCAPLAGPTIVHAARYGIPGISGTWGRMQPLETGADHSGRADTLAGGEVNVPNDPASAWLICYEAFLAWPWIETLTRSADTRPIIILSNDGAFGDLPIDRLRRKVVSAMAGLVGRPVLQARTGETFLINTHGVTLTRGEGP